MDACWAQGAFLLGKKGHPETSPIIRQAERDHALVIPPDRNRRAAETAMYRLVVGTDDVERDVPLELPQGERGMPPRIVFASFGRIAESCAWQKMQFPHLRSDQALDVAAKARFAWRSPFDGDSRILASSLEGPATEVGAIVDVQRVRETGDGPWLRDLALTQPRRLVEDGMQQAKARRQPRGQRLNGRARHLGRVDAW